MDKLLRKCETRLVQLESINFLSSTCHEVQLRYKIDAVNLHFHENYQLLKFTLRQRIFDFLLIILYSLVLVSLSKRNIQHEVCNIIDFSIE